MTTTMQTGPAASAMRIAAMVAATVIGAAVAGHAATDAVCERAARRAAAETGVPADILIAIARTETGRSRDGTVRAWPWAVNVAGRGAWFEDRAAALAHARGHRAAGVRNIDLGCFQINHRWHGAQFAGLAEMLDPLATARYAARFLRELHGETGDWVRAAGAYHSRTPHLAQAYLARFEARLAELAGASPPAPAAAAPQAATDPGPGRRFAPRPALDARARAPLVPGGDGASRGSLVTLPGRG